MLITRPEVVCFLLLAIPSISHADWKEADYVNRYCMGKVEYVLPDRTRIDCLTETHAIEFDFGRKWAEALGQSVYYSAQTGKRAGIVLILDTRTEVRYLNRLRLAVEHAGIDVDISIAPLQETIKTGNSGVVTPLNGGE